MKYLLYLLLVYFGCRGIILNLGIIPPFIDFGLNLILKGSFLIWFMYFLIFKISKNNIDSKDKIFIFLFLTFLLSGVLNGSSIDMISRFFLNVFYPIAVFYYVIYKMKIEEIIKLFNFAKFYFLIQIIFSFISNSNVFLSGRIIVDDFFFGFFGFPNAYQFSFTCTLISLFLLKYLYEDKSKKKLFVFFVFLSVPFFAGAGRTIFIFIPILLISLIILSRKNFQRIIILVLVSLLIIPIVSYYKSKMKNFDDGVELLKEDGILENPKVAIFIKTLNPVIETFPTFMLGFGPGNYMSWTGVAFNPKLDEKYAASIDYSTGAYQGYNNIIGFWGEIGIVGLFLYYGFIISAYTMVMRRCNYKISYKTILLSTIVVYSIVLSTLFHIFDDAYYSLGFWLFFAIAIRYNFQDRKNKMKLDNNKVLINNA